MKRHGGMGLKRALPSRHSTKKKELSRFLIVTEGTKTEPLYFRSLLRLWNISWNVDVFPATHSSPNHVLFKARELARSDSYDAVYCVIDRDIHPDFDDAVEKMRKNGFRPIISVPCFEVWLLLHFKYTTKSYYGKNQNAAAAAVTEDLKATDETYAKNNIAFFQKILSLTDTAIKNAHRLEQEHLQEPTTDVHHLVLELQELARESIR